MSYIGGVGTLLTAAEVATILSLTNLVVSPSGQAINKTTATGFGNTAAGGSGVWTQSEKLTLAGDGKTFVLANAPTSVIYLLGGHQPQVYSIDFTGAINGVNKTFAYVTAQDASVLNDQYATYL